MKDLDHRLSRGLLYSCADMHDICRVPGGHGGADTESRQANGVH